MTNWKATVGQKIRRLTPAQAADIIARVAAEDRAVRGATIFHEDIRNLTGGFNSQSINFYVIRRLAVKAGIAAR